MVIMDSPTGVWPGEEDGYGQAVEMCFIFLASWGNPPTSLPQLTRCPPMPSAWGGTEEKHLTSAAVRVLERCLSRR